MEITKIFYLLTENKSADKCVYIKNDLVQKKMWVETGMVVVDFGLKAVIGRSSHPLDTH